MASGWQKVLVLTVGGSAAPLLTAIRDYEPDFTYFLCTGGNGPHASEKTVDGPGDPCGDGRTVKCPQCSEKVPLGNPEGKAIVRQLGLTEDRYQKFLLKGRGDDLDEVLERLGQVDADVRGRFPSAKCVINYTGGTKTMSAGAVLFAINQGWDLALTTGPRTDLVRVTGGENWMSVHTGRITSQRLLDVCKDYLARHEYSTGNELLKPIGHDAGLDSAYRERVARLRNLCKAFEKWDRFDHAGAVDLLTQCGGDAGSWAAKGKELTGKTTKDNPCLLVCDLVRNAERRAEQKRYDDAVARLYRAVELLSQAALRERGFNTSNLDLARIPEELRDKYALLQDDDGKITLPLVRGYELLLDLEDPLGIKLYQPNKSRLLQAIKIRNNSILAHGLDPVGEDGYQKSGKVMHDFIMKGVDLVGNGVSMPQLPGAEIIGWCGF